MTKVQKPKGLIGYDSEVNTQKAMNGLPRGPFRWFRARSLMYFVIWATVGLIMATSLAIRPNFDIKALHDRSPLYVTLSDGSIRNSYNIKVMNKFREDREFVLSIDGLSVSSVTTPEIEAGTATGAQLTLRAPASVQSSHRVFVTASRAALISSVLTDTIEVELVLTDVTSGEQRRTKGFFYGPQ